MSFEGFPFVIGWELTLACNLRCRHCGSSAGSSRNAELTLDACLELCRQFRDLLVQQVHFTGGEPLLFHGWSTLARRLARDGVSVRMVTNALALTRDAALEMADSGIAEIGVSLDGPEATHDALRAAPGAYRRTLAGIEHAKRAGVGVSIITTIHGRNIDALPTLAATIRSIGVRGWQIQPLFPSGRACLDAGLLLSERDYLRLGAFVLKHKAELEAAGLKVEPADSYGYFTRYDGREPGWHGCPAGIFSCGITSDGKLKGCLALPDELCEGDLNEADLWDLWFREGAFAYNRNFEAGALGPSCATCEMAHVCRGGCSAMSYASSGSFHNDRFCFLRMTKEPVDARTQDR